MMRLGLKGLCVVWLAWGGGELFAEEWRDPFLFGPRKTVTPTDQPVLIGIFWDARRPLAIINGEPVGVGESVADWKVVEIKPDYIVLQRDSERTTIVPGSPLPSTN